MKRETMFNLSIVFSLVYLVYLFLAFYGYTRSLSLRYQSIDPLIEGYSKLEPIAQHKVVLAIMTESNEVNSQHLKTTLKSLLNQTLKVSEIMLIVSPSKEERVEKDGVPVYISQTCKVYNSSINPFYTAVMNQRDANTVIIFVNDKTVYGEDYVEFLMSKYSNNIVMEQNGYVFNTDYFKGGNSSTRVEDYLESVDEKIPRVFVSYSKNH